MKKRFGRITAAVVMAAILCIALIACMGPIGRNQNPVASFTATIDTPNRAPYMVAFDASLSSDPDGTIETWEWDFGDDTLGIGETTVHIYALTGTYSVNLTVIDNKGAINKTGKEITIQGEPIVPGPRDPVALFSFTPLDPLTGSAVTFNAQDSYSPDAVGNASANGIVYLWWRFGDGTRDQGIQVVDANGQVIPGSQTIRHTYALPGTYTVRLGVYDDADRTDTVSHDITVVSMPPPPPNLPPVADFTYVQSGSDVAFDGSASSDSDGAIVSYVWRFGDGGSGSGITTIHTYTRHQNQSHDYRVQLTVTDNDGATDFIRQDVTVDLR